MGDGIGDIWETDRRWMRRALRLAKLGREAAPNPMVGCVLLDRNGAKVGEGYHLRPGEPHAEVNALAQTNMIARNGTAYVTLEPCAHFGRTPPCADALIAAGINRCVVAMADPDERVAGKGIQRMNAARIEVVVGICAEEARRLCAAYIKHRTTGLPYVTLKTAMTLDGRIATVSGDSRWITSPLTRLWVHRQLRRRNPAVIVGVGTVLADNPVLDVRLAHTPHARNPVRIVVDSRLRIPLDSALVERGSLDGNTVVAYVDGPGDRKAALEAKGVRLIRTLPDASDRVDLRELMGIVGGELELTSVLVEGGPSIAAALLRDRLVDKYICTLAPKLVGGARAHGPIGGPGLASLMSDAVECTGFAVRRSGPDVVLSCEIPPMV
jgi:diaminohydroxyphosphoribosylaminopyrimidine deaminase/5-amino-6-(5-phosphoribosylamino)uracil reductase